VSLATRCMAFATPPFRFSANLVCAPPPLGAARCGEGCICTSPRCGWRPAGSSGMFILHAAARLKSRVCSGELAGSVLAFHRLFTTSHAYAVWA
jgi:hypothetical protein